MSDNIKIAAVVLFFVLILVIVYLDRRKKDDTQSNNTSSTSNNGCNALSSVEYERIKKNKKEELLNKWVSDSQPTMPQYVIDIVAEYLPYAQAEGVDVSQGAGAVLEYAAWAEAFFFMENEGYCNPNN